MVFDIRLIINRRQKKFDKPLDSSCT